MTPQSHFTVVAAVAEGRLDDLQALLATMNLGPGRCDPHNALIAFGKYERLHFARLVILDDTTLADLRVFGLTPPKVPSHYLVFMGDCDGPGQAQLEEFTQNSGDGLRRIFEHCVGFEPDTDLYRWLLAHDVRVATRYVNWIGRTVRQIHEESALQQALAGQVPRGPQAPGEPQSLRRELIEFVRAEQKAGRLTLTPPAPTPMQWQVRNWLHLIGVPLVGLILLPLLIVLLPLGIYLLRRHETTDPEYCPRPDAAAVLAMQELEDHDLSNSFTAFGPVKPGLFRNVLVRVVLFVIDYAARHFFARGHLARVRTIHFARWVFLDGHARVLFASNYDGSHESYMDDFINKVAWGLNLSFSSGFGWPRTDWLIKGGARRELKFKYYQRRHQLPTQVWYKAYPGLTLSDLNRNRRIREGLERDTMSEAETIAWLRLL